ncbi:MAG: multi antimicrobial extrusion protein MatE [Marmoricola sp.]|nr:multi antimicrobial extrusion protein MatE [Marmoricola sp.]
MTDSDRRVDDNTRRHLTQVARGGALGLVGAGVSAISGFVLVLIVTNLYGSHDAGLFFTVTSAFMLMSAVATLGTETGLGRFLLRYEAQDRRGDIPPTLRAAFRPTITYSVVIAIAVVVFADPLAERLGLGDTGAACLQALAAVLPLATWNALTLAGTRAFGQMKATVLVDKIGRSAAQPLLVLLASLSAAGLLGMTIAWAAPYAVSALVSAWLFRQFLRRRGTHEYLEPTRSYRELKREFWRFTWPRSITRISQMAIQRLDILLIAAMRGPRDAAIYTAATRFVALGQFGTQAIQQVLQPKFTALLAGQEHESLREVYQVSAAWSMIIAWPMYMIVAATPLAYLGLFGPEYSSNGVAVVLLMAGAMLFSVASGPADTLLLMSGRSALSLMNSLAALALDVVLCVMLIPSMGITGAALAWAIAVGIRNVLSLVQVRVMLSIVSFGPAAAIAGAANVLCFGAPLVLLELSTDLNIVRLALALLVCVPLYVLALWLGRHRLRLSVLRGLVRRAPARAAEGQADDA